MTVGRRVETGESAYRAVSPGPIERVGGRNRLLRGKRRGRKHEIEQERVGSADVQPPDRHQGFDRRIMGRLVGRTVSEPLERSGESL